MKDKNCNSDKRNINDKVKELTVMSIKNDGDIVTDPEGSYTGVPLNPYEKPIQDVDDL